MALSPGGRAHLLLLLAAAIAVSLAPQAGGAKPKMRIGTCAIGYCPFVCPQEDGSFTGLDVDTFQSIYRRMILVAKERGIPEEMEAVGDELPDLIAMGGSWEKMVEDTRDNVIDVLFCAMFITKARSGFLDFTYPYLETGYRMVVRTRNDVGAEFDVVTGIFANPSPISYFFVLFLVVLAVVYAHIMYGIALFSNTDGISTNYGHGVFDTWWLAMVTATTVGYGDKRPIEWMGRMLTLVWIVVGLYCVGMYAGSVTASVLNSRIRLENTAGRITDTTALMRPGSKIGTCFEQAQYAAEIESGRTDIELLKFSDCYKRLADGTVDIIVDDAKYAQFVLGSPEFKGNLTLVGPVFQPVDYGMLVSRPNGTVHPLYHVLSLATYDWFKSRSLVPGTNKSYRDSALENVDRYLAFDDVASQDSITETIESLIHSFNVKLIIAVICFIVFISIASYFARMRRTTTEKFRRILIDALELTNDDFLHQSLVRNAATRLFEEIDVDGNHVLDTEEFLGILRDKGFSLSPLATAEILEAEAIACGIDTADDGKIIMNKEQFTTFVLSLVEGRQAGENTARSLIAQRRHIIMLEDGLRVAFNDLQYKINRLMWLAHGGQKGADIPPPPMSGEPAGISYGVEHSWREQYGTLPLIGSIRRASLVGPPEVPAPQAVGGGAAQSRTGIAGFGNNRVQPVRHTPGQYGAARSNHAMSPDPSGANIPGQAMFQGERNFSAPGPHQRRARFLKPLPVPSKS